MRWLVVLILLMLPIAAHAQTSCGTITHRTISLDVATVTTGGTPVTAINAGHAVCGGVLVTSNAAGMCVNQNGDAGTATAGDTICVAQNVPYYVIPSAKAVSVNSTASSVAIGGYGFQ